MSNPDISNLPNCIEDCRVTAMNWNPQFLVPDDYFTLLGRLRAIRPRISPLYQQSALDPFLARLDQLGESGFGRLMLQDTERKQAAGLLLDISEALLQYGEGFETAALGAFAEVVSDLYDGFLSSEDRHGVKPPDREVDAPLVKFSNPSMGPYIWTIEATQHFGLQVALISMPPGSVRSGLMGWLAIGHEGAGHDILHADTGLLGELREALQTALSDESGVADVARYWSDRVDESASDVCGILNMGPTAGLGMLAFFRGMNAAYGFGPRLRTEAESNDSHPADILRGYLSAATVRLLDFTAADAWADLIESETDKDCDTIRLCGDEVAPEVAKRSAAIVARVIVSAKMRSLEQHGLGEIQNWRDSDERIVQQLVTSLTTARDVSSDISDEYYAAHIVAAAATAALSRGADLPRLFQRMVDLLDAKHKTNPSYGPLLIRHPGNLHRMRAFVPLQTARATASRSMAGQRTRKG
jgi:hypothetical protein